MACDVDIIFKNSGVLENPKQVFLSAGRASRPCTPGGGPHLLRVRAADKAVVPLRELLPGPEFQLRACPAWRWQPCESHRLFVGYKATVALQKLERSDEFKGAAQGAVARAATAGGLVTSVAIDGADFPAGAIHTRESRLEDYRERQVCQRRKAWAG